MTQNRPDRPRKYVGPRKTKPVFMPEDLFFKIAASGRNFSAETVRYWELALNSDPLGIKDLERKVEIAEIELGALKGELEEKYRLEEQMEEAPFQANSETGPEIVRSRSGHSPTAADVDQGQEEKLAPWYTDGIDPRSRPGRSAFLNRGGEND